MVISYISSIAFKFLCPKSPHLLTFTSPPSSGSPSRLLFHTVNRVVEFGVLLGVVEEIYFKGAKDQVDEPDGNEPNEDAAPIGLLVTMEVLCYLCKLLI